MPYQRNLRIALVIAAALCAAARAHAFGFDDVVAKAQTMASHEYEPPKVIPEFLRNLGYDDYQSIRFRPEASLWRQGRSRFQVMMVPAGSYYQHAVALNVVDSEGVHPVPFDRNLFDYPSPELLKRVPADLGYAGFKLTYPLAGNKDQNQVLVFAGASYFRGVGAGQQFGMSARGIAVDTGLASGEEFPVFREFWLERPRGVATSWWYTASSTVPV